MQYALNNRYYVYIVTNQYRTALEIGIAGDLSVKLYQLEYELQRGSLVANTKSDCVHLIYWETLDDMTQALLREKKIKKLSRRKCEALIVSKNPGWKFFNDDVYHAARIIN